MRNLIMLLLPGLCQVSLAQAQTKDCEPVADRAGRAFGCFVTARTELGALPRDTTLFWHVVVMPSMTAANSAAHEAGRRGTAVQSLDRAWLFVLAPDSWRTTDGARLAMIGPLSLVQADSFAAVYMEGVFRPGMQSPVHRHPGVEAWYTLEGEMCLESPWGTQVQKARGPGVMITGGQPMMLTGTGTEIRRSLVLILQDATQPRSTHALDWTPKGLCT